MRGGAGMCQRKRALRSRSAELEHLAFVFQTALVVPSTLTPSLPSDLRMTSMAYSFCTMSRVAASMVTGPRGPLAVQPFIASITCWPSVTFPLSFLIASKMACMVSQPAADMKSG